MCRNTSGKYHRSDEGLLNFFQTIPAFILTIANLCGTMKAE